MEDTYRNRIIDKIIERKLQTSGALLIEGTKWCGKTTSASRYSKSFVSFSTPKEIEENLRWSIYRSNRMFKR